MSEEENDRSLEGASEPEVFDAQDTIKILLATDCHLGYERSTKRAQENDSLVTFEEILQLAVQQEVDFILLGGDLFHDTKPPQDVVSKCIELLRKYCLGTRDVKIQLLTDPDIIFKHCDQKTVNFEDPNLNISIPVFSIHGNHDDPSSGAMGALDLLSSTGFVNYFGKWTDLTQVEIPPLILKKGRTYISLYGLSYMNDKRLARIFRDGKFKMLRAAEIPESFNMFVLHQNRTCHGLNNLSFIKEEKLPEFLNFIMWGHEHECRITPEYYDVPDYWISQPGSSVATSLSEGEAVTKKVGLLSVHKTNFKFKSIKLETVRPFVLGNISVKKDMDDIKTRIKDKDTLSKAIMKKVDRHIETELIRQAVELCTDHPNQPQLPLIRIRVHISNEDERFETMKLAQKYCEQVANPMDMITFYRESKNTLKIDRSEDALGELAKLFSCTDIHDEIAWNKTVQDGIRQFFEMEENKDKLSVLSVAGLNEALALFTEGGHTEAFENLVDFQIKRTVDHLVNQEFDIQEDINIKSKIKEFQIERMLIENSENPEEIVQLRQASLRKERKRAAQQNSDAEEDNQYGDDEDIVAKPAVRGRGRGRGKAKVAAIVVEDDEEVIEDVQQPATRGRGRGRAQTTAASKRGRGRAAKQLNSTIDVTITPTKPPTKGSTTSKAISSGSRFFRMGASQSQAKDDEFVDSD